VVSREKGVEFLQIAESEGKSRFVPIFYLFGDKAHQSDELFLGIDDNCARCGCLLLRLMFSLSLCGQLSICLVVLGLEPADMPLCCSIYLKVDH
jgi:hypothetical protein